MPPTTIAGRYRVERTVGRGGMGEVWLCTDEVLGRRVAVKEVGHFPGESTPDSARALREARSSAALSHPNVVSIFDAVEDGDHIWLVMEYVPGRSLSELLREEGRLAPERAAWIGAQVADGLAAAHLRGTTHRDVKPGNILVTDNDHAKITDFGIARTEGDLRLTQTGMVTGTPAYFSPELARGGDPAPSDDVWALGATLYASVEGAPPFPEEGNALALLSTIANNPPPRPTNAGPLTDVIVRMMAVDPSARATMADVAHQLLSIHEGRATAPTRERVPAPPPEDPTPTLAEPVRLQPTPAEPPSGGVAAPAPERRRRRRWPLLVLAAAAVAVAVFVVGNALLGDDPDPEPDPTGAASGDPATPGDGRSPSDEEPAEEEPVEPESPATDDTDEPADTATDTATDPAAVVADYYALLPGDTRAAWDLLAPESQDEVGSYGSYRGFWATIDSVSVDGVTEVGAGTVQVTLTYVTDGSAKTETREIEVTDTGDGPRILDGGAV